MLSSKPYWGLSFKNINRSELSQTQKHQLFTFKLYLKQRAHESH